MKTIMHKINVMGLLGLFLTLSTTLYGAQGHNESEAPQESTADNPPNDANNAPNLTSTVGNGGGWSPAPYPPISMSAPIAGNLLHKRHGQWGYGYRAVNASTQQHLANHHQSHQQAYPPSNYICNRCNIAGHWAEYCPQNSHNSPQALIQPNSHTQVDLGGPITNPNHNLTTTGPSYTTSHTVTSPNAVYCPQNYQNRPQALVQPNSTKQVYLGGQFNSPNGNPPTTAPYYTTNHTFTYSSNVISPPLNAPCPLLYDPYMIPPPNPQNSALLYNPQYSGLNAYTIKPPVYNPQYRSPVSQTANITQQPPSPQPYEPDTHKPKKAFHSWFCRSIHSCKALFTVINCLKYWRMCENKGCLKNIFDYLSRANKYMHIVEAYHHLLDVHLSAKHSRNEYNYIYKQVRKALYCDFSTCKSYTRNQGARGKEEKKTSQDNDKEYLFLRDLLDTIHAYLVHGPDSGHRYVFNRHDKSEKEALKDDEKDQFENALAGDGWVCDYEISALKAWQAKFKPLQCTQDRGTKFQIKVDQTKKKGTDHPVSLALLKAKFGHDPTFQRWMQYVEAYEYDTDCIVEQLEDEEESILYALFTLDEQDKSVFLHKIKAYITPRQVSEKSRSQETGRYGFGKKLYYWEYYKTSEKKHNWYYPDTPYKDLYVPPAYVCLKSEILAKGISIAQWDQNRYAADTLRYQSATLRRIRAHNHKNGLCSKYNIREHSILSAYHILSILFYANFTGLSTAFKETFSYVSPTESLQDIIRRNAQWHFLSKHLREAVEVFGEKIGVDHKLNIVEKGSFYCGAPYLLFTGCTAYFYGPLSTSKQLTVPTLFTDREGVVVVLKRRPGAATRYLKFFNVGLISSFAAEEENLFMGGQYPLQVGSICLLKMPNMSLQPLMHTLDIVDQMLHGEVLDERQVFPSDIALFKKLLYHSPSLPHYLAQLWNAFKHRWRRHIKVNMDYMYSYYSEFIPLLFLADPNYKHVLRFDIIAKTFPNTDEIICAATDIIGSKGKKQDYSSDIVNSNFIWGIKGCVEHMAQDKSHKVTKITIRTYKSQIKDGCNLYIKQFRALGWYIGKGINTIEVTKQPYEDCIAKISLLVRKTYPLHESTSRDVVVFNQLIAGAKEVPADVQQRWNQFANSHQKIKVNIKTIYKYYPLFAPELLSKDRQCKNLLLFDKLSRIFPNIKEIVCTSTDNITGGEGEQDYASSILSSSFIFGLKRMLGTMSKHTQLSKIMITTSKHRIKDKCNLYATAFGALGWHIGKGAHTLFLTKDIYDDFKGNFIDKIATIIRGVIPKHEITSLDMALFRKLMAREKDIPSYVQRAWDDFRYAQQTIEINIKCLHKHYSAFCPLLLSKSVKNLLLLAKLIEIFPNVTQIVSSKTNYMTKTQDSEADFSPTIVGSAFMVGLHTMLAQYKWNKLKKISITTSVHAITVDCNLHAIPFNMLRWIIRKENIQNGSRTNGRILLTRHFFKTNTLTSAR